MTNHGSQRVLANWLAGQRQRTQTVFDRYSQRLEEQADRIDALTDFLAERGLVEEFTRWQAERSAAAEHRATFVPEQADAGAGSAH